MLLDIDFSSVASSIYHTLLDSLFIMFGDPTILIIWAILLAIGFFVFITFCVKFRCADRRYRNKGHNGRNTNRDEKVTQPVLSSLRIEEEKKTSVLPPGFYPPKDKSEPNVRNKNKNDFPFKPLNVPEKKIEPKREERITEPSPVNTKKNKDAPIRVVFVVDRKLYNQDYDAIRRNLKASGKLFCDERVICLIKNILQTSDEFWHIFYLLNNNLIA